MVLREQETKLQEWVAGGGFGRENMAKKTRQERKSGSLYHAHNSQAWMELTRQG